MLVRPLTSVLGWPCSSSREQSYICSIDIWSKDDLSCDQVRHGVIFAYCKTSACPDTRSSGKLPFRSKSSQVATSFINL